MNVIGKSQIKSQIIQYIDLNHLAKSQITFLPQISSFSDKSQIKSQIFNFRFKLCTFVY